MKSSILALFSNKIKTAKVLCGIAGSTRQEVMLLENQREQLAILEREVHVGTHALSCFVFVAGRKHNGFWARCAGSQPHELSTNNVGPCDQLKPPRAGVCRSLSDEPQRTPCSYYGPRGPASMHFDPGLETS